MGHPNVLWIIQYYLAMGSHYHWPVSPGTWVCSSLAVSPDFGSECRPYATATWRGSSWLVAERLWVAHTITPNENWIPWGFCKWFWKKRSYFHVWDFYTFPTLCQLTMNWKNEIVDRFIFLPKAIITGIIQCFKSPWSLQISSYF